MGSMILRGYATKYGEGIAGMILCGTSGEIPYLKELSEELKKRIDEGDGDMVEERYLSDIFGWMTERIENPRTPNDWIAGDPDIVDDHAKDPFNNFSALPNIRSLYYFIRMMETINGKEWAEKIPKSIPFYNIAGDQDPVGLYGEGVYAVSNWLAKTGHKVKTRLYSGYRHEIHNYREIRDEVVKGIIDFINEVLDRNYN